MKRQGVFLLSPLNGMLVHPRVNLTGVITKKDVNNLFTSDSFPRNREFQTVQEFRKFWKKCNSSRDFFFLFIICSQVLCTNDIIDSSNQDVCITQFRKRSQLSQHWSAPGYDQTCQRILWYFCKQVEARDGPGKKLEQNPFPKILKLNVGGHIFLTSLATLHNAPSGNFTEEVTLSILNVYLQLKSGTVCCLTLDRTSITVAPLSL